MLDGEAGFGFGDRGGDMHHESASERRRSCIAGRQQASHENAILQLLGRASTARTPGSTRISTARRQGRACSAPRGGQSRVRKGPGCWVRMLAGGALSMVKRGRVAVAGDSAVQGRAVVPGLQMSPVGDETRTATRPVTGWRPPHSGSLGWCRAVSRRTCCCCC